MVIQYSSFRIPSPDSALLSGRQRRRLCEWQRIEKMFGESENVIIGVRECDPAGVPLSYMVTFLIKSICGIDYDSRPVFADRYEMEIVIPEKYPQADAPVRFRFVGEIIPWHPNIIHSGEMAGNVCLNQLNTFTDIAWGIDRVALYLKYELYHAEQVPPFPIDLNVAGWVRTTGEPNGWVYFDQDKSEI